MAINITMPDEKLMIKRWDFVNHREYLWSSDGRKGVYILKSADDHVLYVGKSTQLYARINDHIRGRGASDAFSHLIDSITIYFVTRSEDLDIYETHAINEMSPEYNRDKVYANKSFIAESEKYERVCEELSEIRYEIADMKYERDAYGFDSFDIAEDSLAEEDAESIKLGEMIAFDLKIEILERREGNLKAEKSRLGLLLGI